MHKALKLFSLIVGIIILVIILTLSVLILFVNPNQFKPLIVGQVKKYTGRELVMDGDMAWSFFPFLGLKAGHMVLGNPAGFPDKIFAEVNQGTISIALTPLLRGKIQSNGIVIDGVKLYLIKNAAGQPNWLFNSGKPSANTLPVENKPRTPKPTSFHLMISTLALSHVNVTYDDQQTHVSYQVKQLALHASHINLMEPFPVQLHLDFAAPSWKSSGSLALTAHVAMNLSKQIYSFRDTSLVISSTQKDKKISATLRGDILANLSEQTLQWTPLAIQMAAISIHGNMRITHLMSHPSVTGQITINPFDLKKALHELGQDNDTLQAATHVTGELSFDNADATLHAKGAVTIQDMQIAKLKMHQVTIPIQLQHNVVTLSPISANMYHGSLSSQAKIDFNSATPHIAVQTTLKNIQSEPLIEDLTGKKQKLTLAGTATIETQLTTSGMESKSILSHLNGNSHFNFDNGSLVGIDLGYLVDSAYALIKKQPTPSNNQNKTNFGNLSGSAMIQNGILSNQDLVLDSPRFMTKGSGTIDLVNQKMNYTLEITVKHPDNAQHTEANPLVDIALPVLISGNLADPSIRLDTAAILKSMAQQKLQNATHKAREKLQEKIKQQLPGQAGELLQHWLSH